MEPIYKLLLIIISGSTLLYFITLGLFNLLKTIAEQTTNGLKGIFFLICLVSCIYALTQRERAPELIDELMFWEEFFSSNSTQYDKPEYI